MKTQLKTWTIILGALALFGFTFEGVEPIKEVFEPSGKYPADQYAKVAVVQWNGSPTAVGVTPEEAEAFKKQNRASLEENIREAAGKGAKLVITPEFGVVGYPDIPNVPPEDDQFRSREEVKPYVEPIPGKSTEFFSKLAKELKVYIHFGLAEVDLKTNLYYNTVVAVSDKGEVMGKYRKIHLYDTEEKFLEPGNDTSVYDSPFGKIGFIICSDVYSSHPMDAYAKMKINVLALSTSWAQYNSGMASFQAGAKWANVYLLAANQTYFPDSGVINPNGTTQSHIRQSAGIAYGYVPYVKKR